MIRTTSARNSVAAALVMLALVLAGCGSNPSHSTHSSTSSGPASTSGGSSTTATKNGIPQGPNAGDADADNSGGPSDGDGNK